MSRGVDRTLFLRAQKLSSRVGRRVAPPASHGSGRADFPHPALQVTGLLIVRCVGAAPHRSPSGELRPSPALLFVRVALRCWWRSVAPSSFPPTIPSPVAALCSPGTLGSVPLYLSSYSGTPPSAAHPS